MAELTAICRCGQEAPAHTFRRNLCHGCQADVACEEHRAELVRLYHKRENLLARGANAAANDRQAHRIRTRIYNACLQISPVPLDADALADRQGRLAREAAGVATSRVLLPK